MMTLRKGNAVGGRSTIFWLKVVAAVAATTLCLPAGATLGRSPWPDARDTTTTVTVSPPNAYAEWTTVLSSGTVVREYANPQGRVFAVRWDGPLLPDLAALFGEHAGEYQQAAQQRREAGQRGGVLQTEKPHIVVVSRGRMGQFHGHAYLPVLVPMNVDVQALLQ